MASDADPNASVIVLATGKLEGGEPYWLYIAVKPSKYKTFMEAREAVRFADYGDILAYGFEEEVPAGVKEEMERKYDCHDDFMAVVTKEIVAAQAAFLQRQEAQRIDDIVTMLKKKPSSNA